MHIEPPENYKLFNLLDYTFKIFNANIKTLLLLAVVSTLPRRPIHYDTGAPI